MIKEAQRSATYDHAGRAVKTTIPVSDNENVNVRLRYDERNRLRHVLCDGGTRIGLV